MTCAGPEFLIVVIFASFVFGAICGVGLLK